MVKRISLIVLYVVLALLLILVVIGAIVQKSYKPGIDNPYSIYCKNESGVSQAYNVDKQTGEEKYNDFINEFNNSLNESYITAVFSGHASRTERIEPCQTTAPTFSDWSIRFTYTTAQTIMLGGKEYKDPTNTANSLSYTEVYFDLQKDKGQAETNMYYVVKQNIGDTVVTNYYKQKILANFNSLYSLIISQI